MQRQIQTFEVSLKAFIVHEGRVLLLRESDTGYWELPGGRIDAGEEWQAHDAILLREIAEELGPELRVKVSDRSTSWTRQRPSDGVFQFIVGRVCDFAGGNPQLSSEHAALAWCKPAEWAILEFPPDSGYRPALDRLWQMRS